MVSPLLGKEETSTGLKSALFVTVTKKEIFFLLFKDNFYKKKQSQISKSCSILFWKDLFYSETPYDKDKINKLYLDRSVFGDKKKKKP